MAARGREATAAARGQAPPADEPDAGERAAAEVQAEIRAQREAALVKARELRAQAKRLRVLMKGGIVDDLRIIRGEWRTIKGGSEAQEDWQEVADNMRLGPLLTCCRGVAAARRQQILEAFIASPRTKLGALTYERREHLARVVRGAREIDV